MSTSGHPGSNSQAKAPLFYKLIHPATLVDGKPVIPVKFVRKYLKNLPNQVFLMVPSGAIWRLELMKRNGKVLLYNGWEEFAKHYLIVDSYILVFRYEGNSRFHVLILDGFSSEIEYPENPVNQNGDPVWIQNSFGAHNGEGANHTEEFKVPKLEESEDDFSVQVLDDFPLGSQKGKKKMPLHNASRINSTFKIDNTVNDLDLVLQSEDRPSLARRECNGGMHVSKSLLPDEAVEASERAKAFKSVNPFFIKTMQPSYVSSNSKCHLAIPIKFDTKYFVDQENIILRVSDGRTWPVKFNGSQYSTMFTSGWKVFARDNHLQVGDACVFELNQQNVNLFNVIIFRAIENPQNTVKANNRAPKMAESESDVSVEILDELPLRLSQKRKEKTQLEPTQSCKIRRPDSTCKMDDALNEFSLGSPKQKEKMPLQNSPFHKVTRTNSTFKFGNTVDDLALESQSEDVQTSDGPNLPRRESNGGMCVSKPLPIIFDKTVQAFERAKAFNSVNPFFIKTLQPSYISSSSSSSSRCYVPIPWMFEKNLISREVILELSDGRTWSVKICNSRFTTGWRAFVNDNCLQVGDVCVFELNHEIESFVNVIIFRATEYPRDPVNANHGGEEVNYNANLGAESESYLSIEMLDELPLRSSQRRKEKTRLQPPRSCKTTRTDITGDALNVLVPCIGSKRIEANIGPLERAKAFKSRNPSFLRAMQHSYVFSCYLSIPMSFNKKYFTNKDSKNVKLRVLDGRSWCVMCKCNSEHTHSHFTAGWKKFVQDNHLKIGDVCVFELIQEIKNSLNVVIFRGS